MQYVSTPFSKFTETELQCKGSNIIKIDVRFAEALTEFREVFYGKPITPSSVCRSPEYNKLVGGHPSSLHLTENPKHNTWGTAALDALWFKLTTKEKMELAQKAYSFGFSVGLHKLFCHIDLRTIAGLPQHCFLYGEWDKKLFLPADVVSRSVKL